MSRAEKIGLGGTVFGIGVTVVTAALSLADVDMSAVLLWVMGGLGALLMVGGLVTATVGWRARHGDPPPPSPAAPSQGSKVRPVRQVRQTEENQPRRPLPPPVADPPDLSPGYPARAELARALRVLATEGDELASDPDAPREARAEDRRERKEWAHRVRTTLDDAALSDHASYFFEATKRTVPSGNVLLSMSRVLRGGDEEIKSGWRLDERLAKLRRIIHQLEEASGQ